MLLTKMIIYQIYTDIKIVPNNANLNDIFHNCFNVHKIFS